MFTYRVRGVAGDFLGRGRVQNYSSTPAPCPIKRQNLSIYFNIWLSWVIPFISKSEEYQPHYAYVYRVPQAIFIANELEVFIKLVYSVLTTYINTEATTNYPELHSGADTWFFQEGGGRTSVFGRFALEALEKFCGPPSEIICYQNHTAMYYWSP